LSEPKRFEEWEVDCNDCARYWDSSCDGVQAHSKPCNSFQATRSVILPAELDALRDALTGLTTAVAFIGLVQFGMVISLVMGWLG
jgi:hypothetical protein